MAHWFLPPSKFSYGRLLAGTPTRMRAHAPGYVGRQLNPPAVWKFEILHVNEAALAFDDKAGADRKAAREATDFGTHGILRFNGVTPQRGDDYRHKETVPRRRPEKHTNSVGCLWTIPPLRGPARRQTARPFCSASALSDLCGRAPMCWITSAAASPPSRAAAR